MVISLFNGVENTMSKGENVGYERFLLFPVFSEAFCHRIIKSQDCVAKS